MTNVTHPQKKACRSRTADSPRLCIAGRNTIAVEGLSLLINKFSQYDICFIADATDNGIDGWQKSLRKYAQESGIRETTLQEAYIIDNLVFISLGYSELIDVNKFKSKSLFNIHFSLLPKYKGMYTSAMPIIQGEDKSGVSLHKIDNGIDTGEIIDQVEFEIAPSDTARDLYLKYMANGLSLFKKNIEHLIDGKYESKPQPSSNSSYYSKKSIDYKNVRINFHKTAFEVTNQFRAFTFREFQLPMYAEWEIYKSEITDQRSMKRPGETSFENDVFFQVSTIDYDVKLFKDYYLQFWEFCKNGDVKGIESIISRIPDINQSNNKHCNAMAIATHHGHFDLVERLIDFGAKVNSPK